MPIFPDYDAVALAKVADVIADFVGIYVDPKLLAGGILDYVLEPAPNDFMVLCCEGAFTSMKTMKMDPGEYPFLMDAVNVGDEVGFSPNIQVGIGMGVAASEFYKSNKTYGPFVIAAEAGYTGKVGIGMGVAASEFYKSNKTYGPFVIAAEAGYTGKFGIGMGVAASEFYKSDKTYGPFVIAAEAGYTGKAGIGMGVAASEFYKSDKTYDLYFNATKAGYTGKFGIGMGVAASEFYKSNKTYGPFVIAAEAGYTGKVGIGMGVAASEFYKSDKTYGPFVIPAEAGYTGKVGIGMGVVASEFYKSDKTYDLYFNATKAGYTGQVGIGMGVAASEFYKPDKTYDLYFIAAKACYTGKHLCCQHSNHEETCSALDLVMNKLRDGNGLIQMHENFGTHDGQFQEGEGGPEDTGFVHDMSLDGVADDPMQIDAVEDYLNYATHSVQVYFNLNSMGLIDTIGIDSPDQLKGAAILIAHLPPGQYIFKYVRYGQEIRMDNDDFHHFLEDLTDIHIWDGELVTVS